MKRNKCKRSVYTGGNSLDNLNYENFKELLSYGCTDDEIASEFNINSKFVERLREETKDCY